MAHSAALLSSTVLLALLAVGCDRESAAEGDAAATRAADTRKNDADWQQFAKSYVEAHLRAQPFFAVKAGRHEYDGQMPDWSPVGLKKEAERLEAARADIMTFDPAAMSATQALERNHLLAVVEDELFWRTEALFPFKNPAWYISQLDPDIYLSSNYAPPEKRLTGYLGYIRAVPRLAANIRTNLDTRLPRSFVDRAVEGFGGFAEFYRGDATRAFAAVQDPARQKELASGNAAAADAMADLARWFESKRKDATDDYALGAERFAMMLQRTERVNVPLERLEELGRQDTERNFEALQGACARFVPGGSLEACVRRVRERKPEGGPVIGARRQLEELKAFVRERNIVTIPSDEEALVAEAPPYNRANAAYINVPGPYDKGQPSIYYVAPPNPKWSAAERADYIPGEARLLFTSVHEVWPGHFLQFLHANRSPSLVSSLWVGYAYAEGWAHYTEEMMWDLGLRNGNPEAHIGQLLAALLRNVRYQCAIGLHARDMSLEACEKLFRERALADAGNARQQAARGTYDPGYLNYTLGKLMILRLREDWLAKQPAAGEASDATREKRWREFHDAFLAYGGPPIPLVRSAMLGDATPPL